MRAWVIGVSAAGLVAASAALATAAPSAPRVLTPEEVREMEISLPTLNGAAGERAAMLEARLEALSTEPGAPIPDLGTLPDRQRIVRYLELGQAADDPALRELFRRAAREQFVRLSLSDTALFADLSADDRRALSGGWIGTAAMLEDRSNTAWLKEQLARIGWFRIGEYGAEADNAAWLMVQHSDLYPEFQAEVLETLEALVAAGETNPRNYAYLHDRVAMHAGRPSRYLTQGGCNAESGLWEPFAPEDSMEAANARRAGLGLDPVTPERLEGTRQMCADFQGG